MLQPTRSSECICGNNCDAKPFSQNFLVLKCAKCGTEHFEPVSMASKVEFAYEAENDKYGDERYLDGDELRWAHHRIGEMSWKFKRVLEIGCFTGFFVKRLVEMGADAYGFDKNLKAVDFGRKKFGLNERLSIRQAEIHDNAPYDAVVLVDVLEHMDDPVMFLRESTRLIESGGQIVISGPTVERRFFDKSDFPPHHIWRFSRDGMKTMLENNGFTVEKVVVERDGMLFLRNLLGRILNGYWKKEFYGDVKFSAPEIRGGVASLLYSYGQAASDALMKFLGLSYCSTLVVARKNNS
ncbi:MAG: class I SAM-dependent methyltransferase [Haliea sp.]|uniref:class I SAM-dependent methyltransferase n=1 Tax=Haliea sp. TaxID=1932666 RepID=UPI0032EB94B4